MGEKCIDQNIFSVSQLLNEDSKNENISVERNSDSSLVINEMLDGYISVKKLLASREILNKNFPINPSMSLFIEKMSSDSKITSKDHLNRELSRVENEYNEFDNIKIKMKYTETFNLPFDNSLTIRCIFKSNFEELMELLVKEIKLSDCKNLTTKIMIELNEKTSLKSSLFIFDNIEDNKFLDDEVKNFIKSQMGMDYTIASIPNLIEVNADNEKFKELRKDCSINLLGNFFDEKTKEAFIFFKPNYNKIFYRNINISDTKIYSSISKVIYFIYKEKSRYTDKLRISKSLLFSSLDDDNNIICDMQFWDRLYKEIINEYDLFIDDKVTKFLTEKKEIIKEQFQLSKEISNQISESKKNLMNNLLSIIGIFLSKFFIDAINKSDSSYSILAYKIALIFSIYLFVMYLLSGEFKTYTKFENRIVIMNTYYPKLYLTNDNVIDELKSKISTPEILQLKKINILTGVIYFFSILFFTYKLGFFKYLVILIFTPDK
ncbi:hypothetical protein ACYKX7_000873 [Enterococcus hirae]|uniref:hypothetical protein n=1 Tax=Enterococcus hirae TaxID=1354 RepID=UPI0015F29AE0|nr:hypothetical protein [Enterococcus hirae]MBA5260506.1 hypothetical protein [Enterococcus hirae]MBA5273748.1 hypothetical protein [Enterococcus hirae]